MSKSIIGLVHEGGGGHLGSTSTEHGGEGTPLLMAAAQPHQPPAPTRTMASWMEELQDHIKSRRLGKFLGAVEPPLIS